MENLDNSNTSSNDPESMKSRVFIGHLATDRLIRQDLQILFEKYGEIEAISMQRGYAFIQFKHMADALNAVDGESGNIIEGAAIDVKMAIDGKSKPNMFKNTPRQRSAGRGYNPGFGGGGGQWRDYNRGMAHRSPNGNHYVGGGGGSGSYDNYRERYQTPDRKRNFNNGNTNYNEIYHSPQKQRRNTTDDTAILLYVVGKSIDTYVVGIEKRLKSAYVQVRVHYITLDTCIEELLVQAKLDGFPYAVIVKADNELHRSMTVSVLHGKRQDHINMNIDGAIPMLIRNYNAYIRNLETVKLPNCPSEELSDLFVAFSKGRYVKNSNIDLIIDYLNERKVYNDHQAVLLLEEEDRDKGDKKIAEDLRVTSDLSSKSAVGQDTEMNSESRQMLNQEAGSTDLLEATTSASSTQADDLAPTSLNDSELDFTIDTEEDNFMDKNSDQDDLHIDVDSEQIV